MRPRARGSAGGSDGYDDDDNGHRQPFRPLQPLRRSRSPRKAVTPTLPTTYTPPREIEVIPLPHTPRATPKPVKRKAATRLKRPATKVKSEPPEIDFSKVRPPSPSDDPLLLSSARSTKSPPLRARLTPPFSSSPSDSKSIDPPLSFAARLSGKRIHAFGSSPESCVHAPLFNVARSADQMSDSDDDGFNLTGEYTGKYKTLRVPTKADPSTSGTKERIEEWGRPVSPFPYSEIMERSLPLSDFPEVDSGGLGDLLDSMSLSEDPDTWEIASEPPPSDEPSPLLSASEEEFARMDDDFPLFDVDAESTQVRPLVQPQKRCPDSDQTILEEQEEEAQIDRELSVPVDDGPDVPATLFKTGQPIVADEAGDHDSSDDDDEIEGDDIIQITSGDAKAAARATAILRMHDYDCILAAEKKKRSSRSAKLSTQKRRMTIENAGISKSYTESRHQRRAIHGSKPSPLSRSVPLLELWRDAEDSVFLEHHSKSYCDASFTLSPLKAVTARPGFLLPPPAGEWTRECWKSLDKCLVAERLAVAAACGRSADLFADAGDISKDAVLERFATQLGGESVLAGLGPEWSRDKLIMRIDVLIKKQTRHATRAGTYARSESLDSTEPRYRGLLQEAMALSRTTDRYPTSESASSDTIIVPERQDARKMTVSKQLPRLEPSWQTSHVYGAVRTPSLTPDPRPPHPKDEVHLRHASPPKKSLIPVPIRPKRLVDLRHLSPSRVNQGGTGKGWPASRRSSGSSVKDLVRQFEGLDGANG